MVFIISLFIVGYVALVVIGMYLIVRCEKEIQELKDAIDEAIAVIEMQTVNANPKVSRRTRGMVLKLKCLISRKRNGSRSC